MTNRKPTDTDRLKQVLYSELSRRHYLKSRLHPGRLRFLSMPRPAFHVRVVARYLRLFPPPAVLPLAQPAPPGLLVALTPAELRQVERAAARECIDTAEWVRRCVMDKIKSPA